MQRHELSDAQWELIANCMSRSSRRAAAAGGPRQVVNGPTWRLAMGAQWRKLPERFARWQTLQKKINHGSARGSSFVSCSRSTASHQPRRNVIERILGRLTNWRRIATGCDLLARNDMADPALVFAVVA